jgi:hypothetical protein
MERKKIKNAISTKNNFMFSREGEVFSTGKRRKVVLRRSFIVISFLLLFSLGLCFSWISAADPQGPDALQNTENRTKGNVSAKMANISGAYIGVLILNATVQNTRWKGFIGDVNGAYTLDDAGGSTLYDWTISTLTGRVFATRNSSLVQWGNVNCSNVSLLEQENTNMEHSDADDNITATFNTTAGATHNAFYVGSTLIAANTCPTLNVYRNNISNDNYWEEMALYDTASTVYAAIIDDDEAGYEGSTRDFQMIVPENGNSSFSGATAYYIYVQLGN